MEFASVHQPGGLLPQGSSQQAASCGLMNLQPATAPIFPGGLILQISSRYFISGKKLGARRACYLQLARIAFLLASLRPLLGASDLQDEITFEELDFSTY